MLGRWIFEFVTLLWELIFTLHLVNFQINGRVEVVHLHIWSGKLPLCKISFDSI
jgi:hypothetical protein